MQGFLNVRTSWIAFLIALSLMGAVCYLAAAFDTFPGDVDGLKRFQALRTPWLDSAALAASFSANTLVAVTSTPAISLALWLGKRRADAVAVLLVLIPDGINALLKVLVDRPRPDFTILISQPHNPSFPSGHSVHAFLLFGLLIIIVGEVIKPFWLRTAIQGLLAAVILACGASRVYLGVHWPSDVLGGFLMGGLSLVAILWVRKTLINRGLK